MSPSTDRQQLVHLIDDRAPGRLPDALAIALLAAPLLLALGLEWTLRLTTPGGRPLRLPWQAEARPDPPNATIERPARGDLERMARVPHYDALVPSVARPPRTTDESGFPNAPSGLADPLREAPRGITLVGASFMVHGRFAEGLAQHTGERVYNAAWEGRGALFPLLFLLDEDLVGRAGEHTLVYGVVQRSLDAGRGWHHLTARLTGDGERTTPGLAKRLRATARNWLRWNQRLDDWLLKTSPLARLAEGLAPGLPPMAFDRGATSTVREARLGPPWDRPILVLEETARSVAQGFGVRGGPAVVTALGRLDAHCRARGVRLVVVLVPDKLQVYLDDLEPVNFRLPAGVSGADAAGYEPATTAFARALAGAGILAVDLLPVFREDLARERRAGVAAGEPLYRMEDTHWSDHGSALAGRVVAERLRR